MKRAIAGIVFSIAFHSGFCHAQDIMVIPNDTSISGNPGSEMIAYVYVINISPIPQAIFMTRTENNLPESWTSSLCFNGRCFAPYIDSVFTFEPLHPHDGLEASIHFSSDKMNCGTARVQIQIGTIRNPYVRTTINLTASTVAAAVYGQVNAFDEPSLMQNYPNPFNPTTTITYELPKAVMVRLSVYDILGREVSVLVDERRDAGAHEVRFDAHGLSSGVYLYRLQARPIDGGQAGDFIQSKKLIVLM